MDNNILDNLENHIFYHGTHPKSAESIAKYGFRVWLYDKWIGRFPSNGLLGIGLYIICDWRIALWFGPTLLRVSTRRGTRILNAAESPDSRIIDYLQKEFVREVLTKPPWKILPRNKKLNLRELVSLFRYHYRYTWERGYNRDREGFPRWPRRRKVHSQLLDNFRDMLIRYGFHGYGSPANDKGIVIFAEDRLVLKETVAQIPADYYYPNYRKMDFEKFGNIEELKNSAACVLPNRQGHRRNVNAGPAVSHSPAGQSALACSRLPVRFGSVLQDSIENGSQFPGVLPRIVGVLDSSQAQKILDPAFPALHSLATGEAHPVTSQVHA